MASERQRAANGRNGRKGGSKTDAGKQRSRGNSLKHGLSASTLVVLPQEDHHEYEAVLHGFRESYQPYDTAEEALVLRLAQAHWRSLRSRRIETGILNITAAVECNRAREIVEDCPEQLNSHNAIAVGFMTMPAERWQLYLRYDTTISRDFFRTLDALTRLQRVRQRNTRPTDKARPVPESSPRLTLTAAAGAQVSDSGIRSVSQNDTAVPCDANAGVPDADVSSACLDTLSPLEPSSSEPVNRKNTKAGTCPAIQRFLELGTLSEGRGVDIAAFDKAGAFQLIESARKKRKANAKLECMMAVREGKIINDVNGSQLSSVATQV